MTNNKAFEEWNNSTDPHLTHNRRIAWQASRAAVIAELESEDLREEIQRILNTSTVRGSRYDAIISAIKTKLGE